MTIFTLHHCCLIVDSTVKAVEKQHVQSCQVVSRLDKPQGRKGVVDVQNWLSENFNEEINFDLLADKAGMSRRTFERHFKNATGDSPRQYLQRIRVENAKQFLENGDKTFDEITYIVGYEDSSTFSRVFKKTTGLPPKFA